jgi:hypothetical protein
VPVPVFFWIQIDNSTKKSAYPSGTTLIRSGYKLTAITFSDECGGEDFEEWEEMSPPTLLTIFRQFLTPSTF